MKNTVSLLQRLEDIKRMRKRKKEEKEEFLNDKESSSESEDNGKLPTPSSYFNTLLVGSLVTLSASTIYYYREYLPSFLEKCYTLRDTILSNTHKIMEPKEENRENNLDLETPSTPPPPPVSSPDKPIPKNYHHTIYNVSGGALNR